MPLGSLLRPPLMSDTDCGESPISLPIPDSDHPAASSSVIRLAHALMCADSTVFREADQRHSVTDFRKHHRMETIGQRLRAERERQGITRAELARHMNVAVSTLSDLELDESKSTTKLHLAAERLGLNPRWLETGRGKKLAATVSVDVEWADILASSQQVSLGDGAEAQEYAETHRLKFRADSLARQGLHADKLVVYYAKGDSMEPRIRRGDAILFDTSDTRPADGVIYVIEWRGELYAKRANIIDGTIYFESDNTAGDHSWRKPRRTDDPKQPIHVLGRVRWIGSWE